MVSFEVSKFQKPQPQPISFFPLFQRLVGFLKDPDLNMSYEENLIPLFSPSFISLIIRRLFEHGNTSHATVPMLA